MIAAFEINSLKLKICDRSVH